MSSARPKKVKTLEQMDGVEKADYFMSINKTCIEVMKKCKSHLTQFPDAVLQLKEEHFHLKQVWLENYGLLNKENKYVYGFSFSDLIFTTLCFLHMAENPPLRIIAVEDQNIEATLEVLRFMSCQHTMETMKTFPPQHIIETAFDKVAWIVVYRLSVGQNVKEASMQEIIKHVDKLSLKPKALTWINKDYRDKIDLLFKFAAAPVNSEGKAIREVSWGQLFSLTNITAMFTVQCARFFHSMILQHSFLSDEGILVPTPIIAPELKVQMQIWLLKKCSIDSSDSFAAIFRDGLFGALLPLHSEVNAKTRAENAGVQMLTLIQYELGFDVASKLNNALVLRVRSIGYDPQHKFYDFMVLYMFAYAIRHELRFEKFLEIYYISDSKYTKAGFEVLRTKKRFQKYLREPLIVRLQRKFYVHVFMKEGKNDDAVKKGNWMLCENAIEACLLWLTMLMRNNNGLLYTGHNLSKWAKQFLDMPDAKQLKDVELNEQEDTDMDFALHV